MLLQIYYYDESKSLFKGLDLIDRGPEEYGWRFVTLYRGHLSRTSPRKRNSERQNSCLRRPSKYL